MPPDPLERDPLNGGNEINPDGFIAQLNEPPRLTKIAGVEGKTPKAELFKGPDNAFPVSLLGFHQKIEVFCVPGYGVESHGKGPNNAIPYAMLIE
ncbi:MAG: hypothetical protein HYV02_03385 [Deltaproteobacteria bacterium]|nr:hypothetical protein [Deltaproteobacteria bacterium]